MANDLKRKHFLTVLESSSVEKLDEMSRKLDHASFTARRKGHPRAEQIEWVSNCCHLSQFARNVRARGDIRKALIVEERLLRSSFGIWID